MKNSYKQISALSIIALFLFSSCSRELTSIPQTNKLANAQTLEKAKTPVQKTEPLALTKTETAPPITETNVNVLPSNSGNTIKTIQAKRLAHQSVASLMPKQAGKQILKQVNSLRNLGSNNQISSYSKTNHTEGWLGFAIACLIVGIILIALGFGALGSLFWAIGIIVLVIAIVFFILWLLAEAVSQ